MDARLAIGLPLACCWAVLGASPRQTIQPVILPVVDATDIRFSRVTFGSFKREPAYNRVHSIAQDKMGFLWFATQDKLQRYDGYEIREYPNNPDDPIAVFNEAFLLVDRRDILWGGWARGLDRFDPPTERFKRYSRDRPFNAKVFNGIQDHDGNLWFAADNGLIRGDPDTGRTVTYEHNPEDPPSLSSTRVRRAFEAKDGTFWVATKAGVDWFDRGTGKVRQHIPFPADVPDLDPNPVLQLLICEDHAGVLWMTFSYGYGLARIDREAGTLAFYSLDGTGKDNTLQSGARSIIETEDGALWIGTTAGGLLRLNPERSRFARYRNNPADPNSLSGDQVLGLLRDREGNMWAGTNGAGVNRFSPRPSPFRVYQHRAGDPNSLDRNYTSSIFEDSRGMLWIGSLKALQRFDRKTGKMTFYRRSGGPGELSTTWVISIAEDRAGRLWFGTVGGGVNRLDPRSGKFTVFRHDPAEPRSLSHNTVQAILVDHKGVVWVGTEDGLDEFDEATENFRVYKASDTLNQSRVDYIAEEPGRALWIATQTTGLVRFDLNTHQFTIYRHTQNIHSLSDDGTDSVCIDHNGTIWVGTQNGLNRLDTAAGTFTRYYERDGLAASNVSRILEDNIGDLWVSTSRGLSRFDVRNNRFKNYYVSDGIAGNEFYNYASAFESHTGEMYFSSYAGVTAFFPRDVIDNPYVPPVVITDLRVSGKSLPIGGDSPVAHAAPFTKAVKLSHNENVISLQFSALSFTNPDGNRYRYMMNGLEDSWNESTSDQRFITYSLSPGEYVFRVKGSTSRGAWNEEGTTLQIVILPPWWSTSWFRISSVSIVLLSLLYLYRLRVRAVAREFNVRLEERVSERTRIARALHDTLLQSVQGLMFSFQAARNLLPGRTEEAIRTLDWAIQEGDAAIAEGREAIQGLRANPALESHLEHLLTAAGKELARSSSAESEPPAFQVAVEGARQPLSPVLQDEVYQIAREILRNGFYHARASRIEAEIAYEKQLFRLRIRDNGKGIDRKVLEAGARQGHFGLPGVRERAERIGAEFTLWSELGAGTEAELTVPAWIAYGTAPRRQRLRLFRKSKVESCPPDKQ